MSKGKNQSTSRPLQEGATGNGPAGPGLARPRAGGSLDRLPSLRPKRDLSLGGAPTPKPAAPKKIFTPTIPARRNKPAVPSPSPAAETNDEGMGKGRGKGRERRGRGRGGRGRGERGGRKGRDVITSASVFSMGPAEKLMQKKAGEIFGSFSRSETSAKKKLDGGSGDTNKYDFHLSDEEKEEEMEVDEKQLFSGSQLPPVQLPLDYSLHTRHRTVAPKQIKVKPETSKSGDLSAAAPIKLVKPVLGPANQAKPERMTAAQLFTPSEGSKGQFLFFQLPDCVPVGEGDGRREDAMDTSTPAHSHPVAAPPAASDAASAGKKERTEKAPQSLPSLRDLSDGLMGKMRIHKSGKVKLVLGENTLDVAMGMPCGFLQELVSIRTEQEQPEMTVIGQLSHRLICTPDLESLLDTGAAAVADGSYEFHNSSGLEHHHR